MNAIQQRFQAQGLVRPRDTAVIAGVCAGVGRRFDLGPWTTRALFVLTLIIIPGSQILVYPLLWILMPKETTPAPPTGYGSGPQVPYGTPPAT
jgi:phage shock protein C